MKPRYSFSSRKTKRATKSPKLRKQKEKYPEILERIIRESDIIIEVLDARFPEETQNTGIEKKIKKLDKKLIRVLNKSDLVKKIDSKKFAKIKPFVIVSCKKRQNTNKLRDLIKKLSDKSKDKNIVGVIGYPNTGKSSMINALIGKSSAGTGSDAGFTKGTQKLRLSKNIVLLDTPGVIPKEKYSTTEKSKLKHSAKVGGRSYSQIKNPEMVVADIIKEIPEIFEEHYKIKSKGNPEILLEKLGTKLNFLKKGGKVDFDKTARKILKDWQEGVIRV